jgi:hypothetical protein
MGLLRNLKSNCRLSVKIVMALAERRGKLKHVLIAEAKAVSEQDSKSVLLFKMWLEIALRVEELEELSNLNVKLAAVVGETRKKLN